MAEEYVQHVQSCAVCRTVIASKEGVFGIRMVARKFLITNIEVNSKYLVKRNQQEILEKENHSNQYV